MFSSEPDFRTVISDFEKLTESWTRKAQELEAAMAAAGGHEEQTEFVLRTAGPTQIVELRFTDQATETSPVQLREAVLNAYARLGVASNGSQARAVATILEAPEVAEGMGRALPEDFIARAGACEATATPAPDESGAGYAESATVEQVLQWAEQTAEPETIVSPDPVELMSDVEGWNPSYRGRFDPGTAQYEFDQQIQAISDAARDLGPQLAAITQKASSKWLEVVVNGGGRLVDLRFRPPFRSASAEQLTNDFAELYARAVHQANVVMFEHLEQTQLGGADDPTETLMRRLDAAAEEVLARHVRNE